MKKILFIEDEDDQIMMMKERIESCGYAFISAVDGEEGIKKAYEELPDLILLDIVMPKVNGYEVCVQLRNDSKTHHIPIVVVTASGVRNLEKQCLALGVREIIRKPYDASFLEQRVAHYLGLE